MKSKFFLTFRDPKDMLDYTRIRNKEIIMISFLLLLQRLLFLTILLGNRSFNEARVSKDIVHYNSLGVGIHVFLLAALFMKNMTI